MKRWDVGSTYTPAPTPKSFMNASRGWWQIICSSCMGSARTLFGRRRETVSPLPSCVSSYTPQLAQTLSCWTGIKHSVLLCSFVQTWPTCTPCCGLCPTGCPTWSRSCRFISTTRASEAPVTSLRKTLVRKHYMSVFVYVCESVGLHACTCMGNKVEF